MRDWKFVKSADLFIVLVRDSGVSGCTKHQGSCVGVWYIHDVVIVVWYSLWLLLSLVEMANGQRPGQWGDSDQNYQNRFTE